MVNVLFSNSSCIFHKYFFFEKKYIQDTSTNYLPQTLHFGPPPTLFQTPGVWEPLVWFEFRISD